MSNVGSETNLLVFNLLCFENWGGGGFEKLNPTIDCQLIAQNFCAFFNLPV